MWWSSRVSLPRMAGYSGKTLGQKLGIKPGDAIATIAAPKNYRVLLGPLPDGAQIVHRAPTGGAAIVHLFVTTLAELKTQLPRARQAVATSGAIWVSWYKKASKIKTDVTEDSIRNLALEGDLVDVKVCAVDEQWSGLKLVIRKALR
jgi:hypothetical protein